MDLVMHFLPYLLAIGITALILASVLDDGKPRKTRPERPLRLHRWDDNSTRHD